MMQSNATRNLILQRGPSGVVLVTPSRSRSLGHRRVSRQVHQTRAILEMNKPSSSSNSKESIDPEKLAEDVQREMHYRLAASRSSVSDEKTLYDALSWSVHNRLLDSFEKTHEHWK